MEAREFSSMTRAELRAYLRATDPQADHWLKRANRLLDARLEFNRVLHGWPAVALHMPVAAETATEEAPPVVERRAASGEAPKGWIQP